MYLVKEIFYTLQGEGVNAGRPAVFCRFAGCNLWSGREADRPAAACPFCDTDFVGTNGVNGGKFGYAADLAEAIAALWPHCAGAEPFVVCTGGEPLLQLDAALVSELSRRDFAVAVETNGTCLPPPGLDWICVSPKAGARLSLTWGNELKLVYPQDGRRAGGLRGTRLRAFPACSRWMGPIGGATRIWRSPIASRTPAGA